MRFCYNSSNTKYNRWFLQLIIHCVFLRLLENLVQKSSCLQQKHILSQPRAKGHTNFSTSSKVAFSHGLSSNLKALDTCCCLKSTTRATFKENEAESTDCVSIMDKDRQSGNIFPLRDAQLSLGDNCQAMTSVASGIKQHH